MQPAALHFGEELIKELYRITSLKAADEEGGVEGLTLEEFTGVFCSTMGITMSDDDDEEEEEEDVDDVKEDENDNFDEALVFDRAGVGARMARTSIVSDAGHYDMSGRRASRVSVVGLCTLNQVDP